MKPGTRSKGRARIGPDQYELASPRHARISQEPPHQDQAGAHEAGEKARGVAPSANDEQRDGRRPHEGEDGKRHGQPAPSCRLGDRAAGPSSRFVHVW